MYKASDNMEQDTPLLSTTNPRQKLSSVQRCSQSAMLKLGAVVAVVVVVVVVTAVKFDACRGKILRLRWVGTQWTHPCLSHAAHDTPHEQSPIKLTWAQLFNYVLDCFACATAIATSRSMGAERQRTGEAPETA